MTLVGCGAITVSLLSMLYITCTTIEGECDSEHLPMISAIILDTPYDRIFCILTTFFTLAVQQVNARAFYKRLYGISSQGTNDFLLVLAIISCVSLPMIGYFDEHQFKLIHGISAGAFFISTGVYAVMISNEMNKHKDKFPESQTEIARLMTLKWMLIGLITTFIVSIILNGSRGIVTPATEWTLVLIYLNYFGVLAFTSPYYDSIHPYGKLAKQ